MGLTTQEIRTWSGNMVEALQNVTYHACHLWELRLNTNPLSILGEDVVIVLDKKTMEFCKVTYKTKPSEARRRIEEHMSVTFSADGKELYIGIDDGEGGHSKTVPLRAPVPESRQPDVARRLQYELHYAAEYFQGERSDELAKNGNFTKKGMN